MQGIVEIIMKLKYYLRGLGIGIVVTAIIMSITNKPQELTDAQIKMRAMELGMVEESVLADLQAKEDADVETVEDILNQHAQEKEENQEEVSNVEAEMEETAEEDNTTTEAVDENATEDATTLETEEAIEEQPVVDNEVEEIVEEPVVEVTESEENNVPEDSISEEVVESYTIIKVEKGNGSEIVSKRLYEAGLVESAIEYNQFLVKNGYDRRLSVGNHEIPSGATEEEMARILCGMK